jgi:choline transport protein
VFNCYGKVLPTVASAALWTSLLSFLIILIVVPAKAPTHEPAKFVFATFINNTGWSSNGVAFIVGFVNVNWGFSCLDSAVHIAEEIQQPERMIPIAIMGTVFIGFVTSFTFIISMMFSLNDFDAVASTATYVPILELFYQALGNKAGAIVLEVLIIATGIGCQVACHTWQSRLCWSFARDSGLPMKKFLSKVHPVLDIPLNAHIFSCIVVAVLGCLYLGSSTAFARYVHHGDLAVNPLTAR